MFVSRSVVCCKWYVISVIWYAVSDVVCDKCIVWYAVSDVVCDKCYMKSVI